MYSDIKPILSPTGLKSYEIVTEMEAVRNSLINMFVVQKNQVPGKPWFGNPLQLSTFDLFDQFTSKTMGNAIESEVRKFDPRINIENVDIIFSPENNRIIVDIFYSVNLENKIVSEHLYLPFAHNNYSFLGARDVVVVPVTNAI
jgi:phage baseplate assembly protein W